MGEQQIRNVAIIAHVDHGKTTLVDALLRQSGQFRPGELSGECILDSNPIERERGITILSKNCAIRYTDRHGNDYHINIVDTPGHADFGGEVERVLRMADGVLLLVDAFEGPMPQTRYVLSKAMAVGLKPIVVVNKVDRPGARPFEVVDEVLGLFIDLGADDDQLEFPVIYASGKEAWATADEDKIDGSAEDVHDLFDAIIQHVPAPQLDPDAPLQVLVTTLDYNDYVGRIGIGRVFAGTFRVDQPLVRIDRTGRQSQVRAGQLFQFDGLGRREVGQVAVGDICAIVGLEEVDIGDTIADANNPQPLPPVTVDEPTLDMVLRINDGPFGGREGEYVTSRQLRDRLERELQSNVALRVTPGSSSEEFHIAGRGMLHLGILLENMRREGYELTVGKPQVIYREIDGQRCEPIERLVVETPAASVGAVMQLLGDRKAEMQKMDQRGEYTQVEFLVPARGLIGLRNRMLNATGGEAIMHHVFDSYGPARGQIATRANGAMIATETGPVTSYALEQLSDRGVMFVKTGDQVYQGQIVGEHNKDKDITVNVTRKKHVTNIRSSTKEATVTLKAHRELTLEGALEYIEDDELVELTPQSIRLRKKILQESMRRRESRRQASLQGA